MWFWWFMFLCDLMIPLLLIICGRMMWKHPPKDINSMIGYRTSRSMKNLDTWKYAHDYCGRFWWKTGWVLMVLSIIFPVPFYGASHEAIGKVGGILTAVQLVVLISSVFVTEASLKKAFTGDGKGKR